MTFHVEPPKPPPVKIASWNINSVRFRIDIVQRFLHLVQLERLDDRFDLLHGRSLLPKRDFRGSISVPERPWQGPFEQAKA